MNDLRSAGDSTLMSKRMDLMAQSGALHPNRTIKTTGTMSTKRGGSIYDSVRMVGSTAKDAFLGSVRSIRNTVGEVSRSFDSYLSSRSSKKLSLSPSRAAAAFQKKVFQELEALDSVDHAALLQGHGLPELDRKNYSAFAFFVSFRCCTCLCLQLTLSQCVCMLFLQERRCKGFWWRESLRSKRRSRC